MIVTVLMLMLGAVLAPSAAEETETLKKFPLLMPHVVPKKDDTYFCTPVRIDPTVEYYITGFQPNSTSALAHHMLVYGCGAPGTDETVWNCGGMTMSNAGYKTAPTCSEGAQIIYAWAMDAPTLVLPEGVAFKVGRNSPVKFLVLQVHYASKDPFADGSTDDSGVFVYYKETPQPRSAGVLLLATGGRILPHSVEYMETHCDIDEDKVIHPFAFRTHTHELGRVVSGYKVTRKNYEDEWTLLGKKDPQLPQMFYPVATNTTLTRGDRLAARCTMVSERDRVTLVGDTRRDEMCNFYLMYWVENADPLETKTCFSRGPPLDRWRDYFTTVPKWASVLEDGAPRASAHGHAHGEGHGDK